jgi:hypothetical protein
VKRTERHAPFWRKDHVHSLTKSFFEFLKEVSLFSSFGFWGNFDGGTDFDIISDLSRL